MADLTEQQASLTTKITGASSSGVETNYVGADSNGNLNVIDYATAVIGSSVPTYASFIGAKNPSGNLVALITDTSSNLYVNLATSLPAGFNVIGGVTQSGTWVVNSKTEDGSGNPITSDNPGTAGNQRLHVATPDTSTASTALGALNAAVTIAMAGLSSAGLQLDVGTFIGTLVVECSLNGGVTYPGIGSFYDPANSTTATSLTFTSNNTAKTVSLLPIGGSSHIRVRVSAYTSGTANALLRASQVTGAAGAITAAAYSTNSNTFPSTGANTATLVLAANPNRKYAYISNGSGTQVNIQFGSSTGLSTTTGIPIAAKGLYELKGDNLYTGNVYAFCSSNVTLSVTEGTP